MATQDFSRIGLALAMGAAMVGCARTQPVGQRSLRIHFPVVNLVLDPQKMEDAYSMAIVGQIHRGLFRYNTAGEVLADLAATWTEAPNHRSYRIKLKAAKFSDGTPILPVHVQMSFARMFRLGSSMAGDIDYIEGSAQLKQSLDLSSFGVRPIGNDTVEFRLSKPSAIFLKQLAVADCAILKLNDFRQDPDLSVAAGFSGPYKVTSNLKDGQVTITKWRADGLDSPLPPDQVTYFMTDRKPLELALAGETDTLDHDRVELDDRKNLEKVGWAPTPTELSGEVFVVLNPAAIPEEVRKLIFASVSSTELHRALQRDSYRPAFGLIPFGLPGELLAKDVRGLISVPLIPLKKPVTIQLDYEQTSDLECKIAEFLKARWSSLNIITTLKPFQKGEKLQRLFGKKSQAVIGRKAMDYPDGFSVLGYFKGNYDSNYFFVNDPAIDDALVDVLQVFDSKRREQRYREIQRKILKKATLIPLLFGSEASGMWSSKVNAVPAHLLGYHMLPMESVEMRR